MEDREEPLISEQSNHLDCPRLRMRRPCLDIGGPDCRESAHVARRVRHACRQQLPAARSRIPDHESLRGLCQHCHLLSHLLVATEWKDQGQVRDAGSACYWRSVGGGKVHLHSCSSLAGFPECIWTVCNLSHPDVLGVSLRLAAAGRSLSERGHRLSGAYNERSQPSPAILLGKSSQSPIIRAIHGVEPS